MNGRMIVPNVFSVGAVDWNRRLFDALIPLPDGTSYNSYLIQGSEKTALIDTVDPAKWGILQAHLEGLERLDYLIAHHGEQDHSGSIPRVLEKFPAAQVIASPKGQEILAEHLDIRADRIRPVQDGEEISLGDKTLRFLQIPWVHWPETIGTYLLEDQVLFPCDLFGSHFATSELFADTGRVHYPAKRYYAEIMMPFRLQVLKNLEKIQPLPLRYIAPSHGPIWDQPSFIQDAYRRWAGSPPKNLVVLPWVSMHGSTEGMVDFLIQELIRRGVQVEPFDLTVADLGALAMSLVDAATVVVGTCTVLGGPHPLAANAAFLLNALRPKVKFVSVIGSFGWASKAVENLAAMLTVIKPEILSPVYVKGLPRPEDYQKLEELAEIIAEKHSRIELT